MLDNHCVFALHQLLVPCWEPLLRERLPKSGCHIWCVPIIASDRPVLMEKLDQGGGLIFRTLEKLAAHMALLADDTALRQRLGDEARRVALKRYVWNTEHFLHKYLFPAA